MDYEIRAAEPDDAQSIAEVHLASWRAAYQGLLPQRYLDRMRVEPLEDRWIQRMRRPLRSGDQGGNLWVVEARGQVVGFVLVGPCLDDASLIGFAGEVLMLYIHPAHQGRGFGRALLMHALEALSGRDYYWCVIWVLAENRGARAFYERMGLRPDGARRRDRFSGQDVAVVRYAKALNPVLDFVYPGRGKSRLD